MTGPTTNPFMKAFACAVVAFVAIYAGKLNTGKNVQLLAPAVAEARRRGLPVHLLCPGQGDLHDSLLAQLGGAVTLPGVLTQEELARALASADLFLFPSTIDESGNAAVEALATGLPALLAGGSGVAVRMADCPAVRARPRTGSRIASSTPRMAMIAISSIMVNAEGCPVFRAQQKRAPVPPDTPQGRPAARATV